MRYLSNRLIKIHVNFTSAYLLCDKATLKGVLQKNEENETCGKYSDLLTWSCCSFLVLSSPKEASDIGREGPSFHEVKT
jgi:hypothetical protein